MTNSNNPKLSFTSRSKREILPMLDGNGDVGFPVLLKYSVNVKMSI